MHDLVILGGGASGLMAAVSAAQFIPGKKFLILEQSPRVGKKLLVTGNGRCNLTNLTLDPSRYHGAPAAFVSKVLSQLPAEETLALFSRLGLFCHEEEQGRCYPYGNQASAVLDVLRRYLANKGVEERCGVRVEAIQMKSVGYELKTGAGTVFAKKLVLAAGGRAMPSSGSDGSGLILAESLGLKATKPFPSLTPVRVDSPVLKSVKGMRCRCKASLLADKKLIKQETGEIQFTEQGLSGICVFNLSRLAGEFFALGTVNGQKAAEISLSLDLVPDLEYQALLEFLGALATDQTRLPLEQLLGGVLNKRVGLGLLKQLGFSPLSRPIGDLSSIELKNICHTVKDWRFAPTGTLGWQQAQATAGGLFTSQFEPSTLEAKKLPGLYACGELLDVDGDCGGYNLQWAWSSGFTAGKSAAKALEREAHG